ncbi:hypothetical protein EW146_g6707 [Bondarzewia mesenterica]|uniref:Uncharacterized protein n=1 Tax=Bondarzewia mesenterica TaxID=1095465 RepID=A0A4S4LMT9_9AGAM|nr:hypothetical protein EW146_g6707 [Bondarzewia mesenterica]
MGETVHQDLILSIFGPKLRQLSLTYPLLGPRSLLWSQLTHLSISCCQTTVVEGDFDGDLFIDVLSTCSNLQSLCISLDFANCPPIVRTPSASAILPSLQSLDMEICDGMEDVEDGDEE